MSETKQRYNNKSIHQNLSKKILLSTIDYLRYKVENEKLTVSEMQSLIRFFCEGLNLEGTADDFAEFPDKGVLVSETREGIINEVTAIRNARQSVLQQVPAIEQEIKACDTLLLELNPQLKREQEQAGKIASLEKQLAGMSDQIAALTGMLSKTLGKKPKED